MSIGSAVVIAGLRTPLHRVLSGSTDLIRSTVRRSGRVITPPTQYATNGEDLVIMVGLERLDRWTPRPGTKA